ncbi:MAG: serine/threonine protein phosphatase [Acidobacteria bacterium]|nr:serine/threonine protein phosphatase [Acidobacteriota bacterium]
MATYVIGDIHGRAHLLDQLLRDLPWNVKQDKIVFLGDLIDRGPESPAVIDRVMALAAANPQVIVLRGNHEQMLLDCLEYGELNWLIPENGGQVTLKSYGISLGEIEDIADIKIPEEHFEFLNRLPFYHEDEQAIYVHAGLIPGLPPAETDPDILLWTRDLDFYRNYHGKLCFFGHTPTHYLPKDGRRKFGIYIHGGCVGIDTSGQEDSPLSCLNVESFALYQAYPTGKTEVERLREAKPAFTFAANEARVAS